MTIKLTKGYEAIVDEVDYFHLSQFKWIALTSDRSSTVYAYSAICGLMHRYILNCSSEEQVDHKDNNGLNNRRSNIRIATSSQNITSRSKVTGNKSSKYKGVSWYPTQSKWRARITKDGEVFLLGYFKDEVEAAKAYNEKALELYGDFASLNDIFGNEG